MNSQELLELISAKNYKGIVLIDDITLFNIPAVNDYHCYLIKVDELVYYSVYIFYDNAYLYNLAHKSVAVPEIISGFLYPIFTRNLLKIGMCSKNGSTIK